MESEKMEYDVLIVGAGPAGLAAAIRLKQLAQKNKHAISICVIEKAANVGDHILSGAVFEPRVLDELIPDWRDLESPIKTPVTKDHFWFLTKKHCIKLPTPNPMKNQGNYIISLGELTRWLAEIAQNLGIEIYPGFSGYELLLTEYNVVYGIRTGNMGSQPGVELIAKQTLLAEGCRGSLSKQAIKLFKLDKHSAPQTYAIGLKELWQIPKTQHRPGFVLHTVGWPLDSTTYGGSFLYHFDEDKIALGFVIGLDYQNTYLNPFNELQRFKTHPNIKSFLEHGQRISYGARALNEGGFQSIPKLTFPGGMLIGCSAGFLNVPKIKGSHTAMKSGMLAAEAVFEWFKDTSSQKNECYNYSDKLKSSWVYKELYQARNIRPAFRFGLLTGLCYAAFDTYILRGHAPWSFSHTSDYTQLKPKESCKPIDYPKPDGVLTFDRTTSVNFSNVHHNEDQPCHLVLTDPSLAISINWQYYDSPEQRYCPAGVYEIVEQDKKPTLRINASNCIHCKTCDIKDPSQNITWVPPEGGGGPSYSEM